MKDIDFSNAELLERVMKEVKSVNTPRPQQDVFTGPSGRNYHSGARRARRILVAVARKLEKADKRAAAKAMAKK